MSRFIIYMVLLVFCLPVFGQANWQELFNGQNLEGWTQLNGEAVYKVVDRTIVGVTTSNTPNSFLTTNKTYSDFIFECDVWVDPSINSGIQFRSESKASYKNGRVNGYQFELDPSDRKWAGGIYDEGRRGWLYPLTRNEAGGHAFKNGQWNHVRIEAVGSEINTWVNGIQCARLVDDMTSEGFIALQVHSIGNPEDAGKNIIWKNIKILENPTPEDLTKPTPSVPEISYLNNRLTAHEKRTGWRLLWDGETNQGWRGAKLDNFPEQGWTIEDGVLTVIESGGGESSNGGDIITTSQYAEFELSLEFKLTEGANSGIKYFVDPTLNKGTGSAIGLEFQLLDDKKHPDADQGVNGNRTLGSLYDLIRADNLSEASRKTKRYSAHQWSNARIIVRGGQVEHWLNHIKVVEFNRFSQIFAALVEKSKYIDWPNFGRHPEGYILLQDHGNTVHFRNIKIREF